MDAVRQLIQSDGDLHERFERAYTTSILHIQDSDLTPETRDVLQGIKQMIGEGTADRVAIDVAISALAKHDLEKVTEEIINLLVLVAKVPRVAAPASRASSRRDL